MAADGETSPAPAPAPAAFVAPGAEHVNVLRPPVSWLEIVLVGEDGAPLAGARFRVTLPGGAIWEGRLDESGRARRDRVPAGECRVEFPDLDAAAWEPAPEAPPEAG